jgi:hypothetical protein
VTQAIPSSIQPQASAVSALQESGSV